MGERRRDPHRTRETFLEAGVALADQTGLARLSVNRLVAEAGSSKGAFFHHFPSRKDYVLALHRRVHERLLEEIVAAVAGMEPGRERLVRGADAYLDAFLRDRGIRGLLLDARAEPLVLAEVARRNDMVAAMLVPDLTAIGMPEPEATARLWVAVVAEAAIVEYGHGRKHKPTRTALAGLLRG